MSLATNITKIRDYGDKNQININPQPRISQKTHSEYGVVQDNLNVIISKKLSYDESRKIVLWLSDGSRIEYKRSEKKSKLPLILSALGLSALIPTALMGLPQPYGIILSVAMCGPLYVSLYGLKKND